MDEDADAFFSRFTEPALESLLIAEKSAKSLGWETVEIEHLFYGLVAVDGSLVQRLFAKKGISSVMVLRELHKNSGAKGIGPNQVPFSFDAKVVINAAWNAAIKLEDNAISTGHILLGILEHGENAATQILRKFGTDIATLPDKVIQAQKDVLGF